MRAWKTLFAVAVLLVATPVAAGLNAADGAPPGEEPPGEERPLPCADPAVDLFAAEEAPLCTLGSPAAPAAAPSTEPPSPAPPAALPMAPPFGPGYCKCGCGLRCESSADCGGAACVRYVSCC